MEMSKRYDEVINPDDDASGISVHVFKRDINNKTFQFVYVKFTATGNETVTVGLVTVEPVKNIRFRG